MPRDSLKSGRQTHRFLSLGKRGQRKILNELEQKRSTVEFVGLKETRRVFLERAGQKCDGAVASDCDGVILFELEVYLLSIAENGVSFELEGFLGDFASYREEAVLHEQSQIEVVLSSRILQSDELLHVAAVALDFVEIGGGG